MTNDAKNRIAAYQRIFQRLPWQAYPFNNKLSCITDDTTVRDVLLRLRQFDPATPLSAHFEKATTDMHYVLVGYEEQFVVYWFIHYNQEGDRGYVLYRISDFIEPSFNFLDYSQRFHLPEASMAKVYMEVFSRLNDWARVLDLPYRYEVDLRDGYMGYQKHVNPSPTLANGQVPTDSSTSLWRKLWARWRA